LSTSEKEAPSDLVFPGIETQIHTVQKDIPGKPLGVCYVGRLAQTDKRIRDLIPLVEQLQPFRGQIHFTLVGDGIDRPYLESEVRERGWDDLVTFAGLCGSVEVRKRLATSDVFVLFSAFEGFSLSLCEAMAQQSIPVVTRVSGTEDLIVSGQNGFLFEVGDVSCAAESIRRILLDVDLRGRLRSNVEQTARESLTRAAFAARFLKAESHFCSTAPPGSLRTQSRPRRSILDMAFVPNGLCRLGRKSWRRLRGRPSDSGSVLIAGSGI
jgi:glycosyltransferase involved in cell wall biosynthesis